MKARCCQIVLLLTVVVFNAYSAAAQDLQAEIQSGVQILYAPFSGQSAIGSVNLRIIPATSVDEEPDSGTTDVAKSYGIRFTPSDQGVFEVATANNESIPFSITSNNAEPFEFANNNYLHFAGLNQRSDIEFSYDILIAESIWAAAGTYSAFLNVDIVNLSDPRDILISRMLEVTVVVEPKLQTNLAGQIGSFEDGVDIATIDFGVFETAEQKQIFIQVRGNAKAVISLNSENNGTMVHSVNKQWTVDYSVEVDGETSTLEVPMQLQREVAKNFRGSSYPMTVIVGDVNSSFAGKYRDVITIEVSPQ